MNLQFTVFGTPVPKGSTRPFACRKKVNGAWVYTGKTATIQNNAADLRPWEAKVRDAAIQAGAKVVSGPVQVDLVFSFRRPKCHYGSGKNSNIIKPAAPVHHIQKPDIDKLERAILDGLKGCVVVDDCQVVRVVKTKQWIYSPTAEPRVVVEVKYL